MKIILGLFALLAVCILLAGAIDPVLAQDVRQLAAQEAQPQTPYYIVKSGDSLWSIAARFGVSLQALQDANQLANANALNLGAQLVIPGVEGWNGEIDTLRIGYGETLDSLSRRYQMPLETLLRLNHLTSPAALYVGAYLILPVEKLPAASQRAHIASGQSLFELAAGQDANPWKLALENGLLGAWAALPGDVLHHVLPTASEGVQNGPGALPEVITSVVLTPTLPVQGKTLTIMLRGPAEMALSGSVAGHTLNFFPYEDGYVALQGFHALLEPGLYTLALSGTLPAEAGALPLPFNFSQPIVVQDGDYIFDPPLTVEPETIDPAFTGPEQELWDSLTRPAGPEKYWQGLFSPPVSAELKDCWPSLFGNRRSFNGSAYTYFHSGLDFCGQVGTPIYAPAAGKVVYTGTLTVRGNVTVIDHGWGIYTAYAHQSEIQVQVGEMVTPGQLIGLGGQTGRVTGPHLHWEVWVGGVQVDALEWLKNVYP